MKITKRAGAVALGVGIAAAGLAVPTAAQAASSCTGASGYWTCYSTTTGPAYVTGVVDSYALINNTGTAAKAHCAYTKTETYSSTSSQSVSLSIKAGLWGIADATVTGNLTRTTQETTSMAASLSFDPVIPAHSTRLCEVTMGYYKVGTKWEQWSNYKVVDSASGTTTVPYHWGLRLS